MVNWELWIAVSLVVLTEASLLVTILLLRQEVKKLIGQLQKFVELLRPKKYQKIKKEGDAVVLVGVGGGGDALSRMPDSSEPK